MKYTCPVCGFLMDEPPADFNICPSCGTEFSYHDVGRSHEELRRIWLESGPAWWSKVDPPPPSWNPYRQLFEADLSKPQDDHLVNTDLPATINAVTTETLSTRPQWIRRALDSSLMGNAHLGVPKGFETPTFAGQRIKARGLISGNATKTTVRERSNQLRSARRFTISARQWQAVSGRQVSLARRDRAHMEAVHG